jgi:hypothetical protein
VGIVEEGTHFQVDQESTFAQGFRIPLIEGAERSACLRAYIVCAGDLRSRKGKLFGEMAKLRGAQGRDGFGNVFQRE